MASCCDGFEALDTVVRRGAASIIPTKAQVRIVNHVLEAIPAIPHGNYLPLTPFLFFFFEVGAFVAKDTVL